MKSASTRNKDQYAQLHRQKETYGKTSHRLERLLISCIASGRKLNPAWAPRTILDFGCGKSELVVQVGKKAGIQAFRYDPAIDGLDLLPEAEFDIVINTDVLEHLDQDEVDDLLEDIRKLSDHAFFNIATEPARTILPNGENAHATVRPKAWWKSKLQEHFSLVKSIPSPGNRATFVTWPVDLRHFGIADFPGRTPILSRVSARLLNVDIS